jgi:hypothetical protein
MLRLVRVAYQAESAAFHHEIRTLFSEDAGPFEVARCAVKRLCEHFRWDYVAVFRIARARNQFELLTQYNNSDGELLVKEGYTQKWDEGVLAEVLSTRHPVRVEDTFAEERHNYKRISRDARSCLCYPVVVNESVEWILDCESCEKAAFQEPDEVKLRALINEAERTLTLWFEMHLNSALLDIIDQGVIVVDQANRIERWNRSASDLVGTRVSVPVESEDGHNGSVRELRPIKGQVITVLGADVEAKAALGAQLFAAKPIYVIDQNGLKRQIVASSCDADSAFNRRIWRFSDPTEWDWITALEYMRTTVQGVAQQTRGPLLLANALVTKARSLAQDNPGLSSLLSKVRSSLSKTDITYERLAASLQNEREPVGIPVAVDIRSMLKCYVDDLSDEDRSAIKMVRERRTPVVWADPVRIRFVLNSTIGYLLATRLPGNEVTVHLDGDKHRATLDVRAQVIGWAAENAVSYSDDDLSQESTENRLTQARAQAQQAVTHAFSSVRKVVENNGGVFEIIKEGDTLGVSLSLCAVVSTRGGTPTKG